MLSVSFFECKFAHLCFCLDETQTEKTKLLAMEHECQVKMDIDNISKSYTTSIIFKYQSLILFDIH